jgi:hypothetical protein
MKNKKKIRHEYNDELFKVELYSNGQFALIDTCDDRILTDTADGIKSLKECLKLIDYWAKVKANNKKMV